MALSLKVFSALLFLFTCNIIGKALSMYALPGTTSNLDSCKGLKLHMFKGVCTVTLGIARILQLCHARDT